MRWLILVATTRALRGIVFLIPAVLLTIPYGIISLFTQSPWFEYFSWWSYWFSLLSLVPKAIDFIVRVIAIYNAYNVAKLTGTEDEAKSL